MSLEPALGSGRVVAVRAAVLEVRVHVRVEVEPRRACNIRGHKGHQRGQEKGQWRGQQGSVPGSAPAYTAGSVPGSPLHMNSTSRCQEVKQYTFISIVWKAFFSHAVWQ